MAMEPALDRHRDEARVLAEEVCEHGGAAPPGPTDEDELRRLRVHHAGTCSRLPSPVRKAVVSSSSGAKPRERSSVRLRSGAQVTPSASSPATISSYACSSS